MWSDLCLKYPNLKQANDCLDNVPLGSFWSLANQYTGLVSGLHVQVRIMENFGLNGDIPWFNYTEGETCFVCKQGLETVTHFLLECPGTS